MNPGLLPDIFVVRDVLVDSGNDPELFALSF